ncbi:MAG TPA: Calx-beta domain-containing protein, partial [Thermoanaerobaculia bacterium]
MRFLAAAALAMALPVAAQTMPYLVRDINDGAPIPNPIGSKPGWFVEAGGTVYLAATTNPTGTELWAYDGASTRLVKDIAPGTASGYPSLPTRVGNTTLFSAQDPSSGRELWQTDGTTSGTALFKEINPNGSAEVRLLYVLGDRLTLMANDGVNGWELWTTDGTAGGTQLLADLTAGAGSTALRGIAKVGSRAYLSGPAGVWVTDGTAAGTSKIFSASAEILATAGTTVLFAGQDAQHGTELWKTDGTVAGTVLVKDIFPGQHPSFIDQWSYFRAASGDTFAMFFAYDGTGADLWKSDGTTSGTVKVKRFAESTSEWSGPSDLPLLTHALGLFWMSTSEGLWRSDGTAAGTTLITHETAYVVRQAYSKAWFLGTKNGGLWSSDGTAAGTTLVKQCAPLPFERVWPIGNKLYFGADDGVTGHEPWIGDGTAAGTYPFANLAADLPATPRSSSPAKLVSMGQSVYFVATADSAKPPQLWKSGGTMGTTIQLTTFDSGTPSIDGLTAMNGMVFFTRGGELWRSSDAGTIRLATLPGPISYLVAAPRGLLFAGPGTVISSTDGTVAGTVQLTDDAGAALKSTSGFALHAGVVYFDARNAAWTGSLYMSDGTPAGTRRVLAPAYGPFVSALGGLYFGCYSKPGLCRVGSVAEPEIRVVDLATSPSQLVAAGPYLYFMGERGLSRTDGTAAGTISLNVVVQNLRAVGNLLFFTRGGQYELLGELGRTDGTVAGTVIFDLNPGPASSQPADLFAADGYLWFRATDGLHEHELWRSDGTAAGTVMVADIAADTGSYPGSFATAGRQLYFAATTSATGRELWSLPLAATSVVSVNDTRIAEGDSGSTVARFTVTREGSTTSAATVAYKTESLTATAGTDFVSRSGVVTFAPGQTAQFVDVTVTGDTTAERENEAFALVLSAPSGAVIARGYGVAVIEEDDLSADLSVVRLPDGRLVVTNAGPSIATGVKLIVTASPAWHDYCGINRCTFDVGDLAPGMTHTKLPYGEVVRQTLDYDQAAPPALTITASVRATEADPNPADNIATRAVVGALALPPYLVAVTSAAASYWSDAYGDVQLSSLGANVTLTPASFSYTAETE